MRIVVYIQIEDAVSFVLNFPKFRVGTAAECRCDGIAMVGDIADIADLDKFMAKDCVPWIQNR